MHTLIQNGKVVFKSTRKIDCIFEHQRYHRKQRVMYKYTKNMGVK